jgi:V/A-type H+-transporting ATPase subunit I
MFNPLPMLRLRVVILKGDERAVLLSLGAQGVLHLTRTLPESGVPPFTQNDIKPELSHCDELLERCKKLEKLLEPFGGRFYRNKNGALTHIEFQNSTDLELIESTLHTIEGQAAIHLDNRQHLLDRKKELDSDCDRASGFRELDIPLDDLNRFSFLQFITGHFPEDWSPATMLKMPATLLPIPGTPERPSFVIITTPLNRLLMERQLQQMNFRQESFPDATGLTANALYLERDSERQEIDRNIQLTDEKICSLASETELQLVASRKQIAIERKLIEARQNFLRTGASIQLNGWTPAHTIRALRQNLLEVTKGRCVIEITAPDVSDGAEVPVLLSHRGWLHPFQKIVSAYGLPEYSEIEPTVFVAISYLMMFGMMFGDAGQGAVLAISGIIALIANRSPPFRDAGLLLLAGGLSSSMFGVLYGSYFGIPHLKHYALWRDPLEGGPLPLMAAAVGLGVLIISIGLILNVINRFRRKEILEALLGRFGLIGILFYWGALTLLIQHDVFQSRHLLWLAISLFLGLPVAGWLLKSPINSLLNRKKGQPRDGESLWVHFAESMVSTFECILLYLANTTSFVRIAAYAMSHAALLTATFAIAAGLKTSITGGAFWSLGVIILGNLIALILEGVIIAVQALRLEYYEFFGKFFSAQGHPFSPFSLKET